MPKGSFRLSPPSQSKQLLHLPFQGDLPLCTLASGAIAQAVGIRQALLISAIGVLLSTRWLVLSPVHLLRELPNAVGEITA